MTYNGTTSCLAQLIKLYRVYFFPQRDLIHMTYGPSHNYCGSRRQYTYMSYTEKAAVSSVVVALVSPFQGYLAVAKMAAIVMLTLLLPALTSAQSLLDRQVDILQTYPPTARDGTQSLYVAVMQSFSGGWVSAGGVPAIQLALDDINANDSVLPGYTLRYELTDTKVQCRIFTMVCRARCLLYSGLCLWGSRTLKSSNLAAKWRVGHCNPLIMKYKSQSCPRSIPIKLQ